MATWDIGINDFLQLHIQVGYATALDVFIIMCFGIVFAALIEFACINFIDTLIRRIKRKERDKMKLRVGFVLLPFSLMLFKSYDIRISHTVKTIDISYFLFLHNAG